MQENRPAPLTPDELAPFLAAGCVLKIGWIDRDDGRDVPEGTPGALKLHSVYAPDGSFVGDPHQGGEHFRGLAAHGIFAPEKSHDPADEDDDEPVSSSIGRATLGEHAGKWFGWSHRAGYAFGVGSSVKLGDCGFIPSTPEEFEARIAAWYDPETYSNVRIIKTDHGLNVSYDRPEARRKGLRQSTRGKTFRPWPTVWGRGAWTAETDADAKQMAMDFANSVA